jgi:opacity protein-like surface antigen
MKRSILPAILLASLATSPLAYSGTYLTVGGGLVVPNSDFNTIVRSNNVFYAPTTAGASIFNLPNLNWNNTFNNGFETFLAMGLDYSPNIRMDLELLYQSMQRNINGTYDWQQVTPIGGNLIATQLNNQIGSSNTTLHTYSLLGNAYYGFKNTTKWTPFVGLGAGIGRLHAAGSTANGSLTVNNLSTAVVTAVPTTAYAPALNGIVFVWQFKAGVTYAITEKISLLGQYRMFKTSSFNINSSNITTNPNTPAAVTYSTNSKSVGGLVTNNFDVGLTYNFG